MILHSAQMLSIFFLCLMQLNLLQTQWASRIQKSNQQDKLYLLWLWHRYTASGVCHLYCIIFYLERPLQRKQLKQSLGGWQQLMCTYVKETRAVSVDLHSHWLSHIQFFIHISSAEFTWAHRCVFFLFTLYVAACVGRLQWYEHDGRGCFRAAHVIACCRRYPLVLLDDMWGGWTSTVHHNIRGDLTGGGRQNSLCADRKCWWELKVRKFIHPALFSNEVSLNSCVQGQ